MKVYDEARLIALAEGRVVPKDHGEFIYVHAYQCAVLGTTLMRTALLVPDFFMRDRHELTMFILGFDAGCVRETQITMDILAGKTGWQ